MPSHINTLIISLLILFSTSLYSQPVTWDSSTSYSTGALVIVGTSTYIATTNVPANNTPPNTTYWTDLSVAAASLNVPVETVPTLDTSTILASLPTAAPDANSTSGSGSSSTSKFQGIAARGLVSSSQPMFGGIAVLGTENLTVAFMGKGQSMGVSSYAADPILEIWSTSGKLSENDNWGTITDSVSSSLSTATGITPPTGSSESGMVMTLAPGNYSFVLKSKSGTLSGAMIEAYEVGTSTSRLQGIAARGLVSSSQPMFGGIAVLGSESKKIAFMGKGQSMGVSPYAADPILEIWSTTGKLSENDNWGSITDSVSSSLSSVTGVTPPTGTSESGMVMTLSPGNYSFVLKSKSGSLSGAMIEAYEVD